MTILDLFYQEMYKQFNKMLGKYSIMFCIRMMDKIYLIQSTMRGFEDHMLTFTMVWNNQPTHGLEKKAVMKHLPDKLLKDFHYHFQIYSNKSHLTFVDQIHSQIGVWICPIEQIEFKIDSVNSSLFHFPV